MKKILSMALSVVMLICVSAGMDFSAGAMANTGKIGNNVYYEFDSATGALTISGSGDIYGYDDGSFELVASWLDMPKNSIYKDGQKVKLIIVKED